MIEEYKNINKKFLQLNDIRAYEIALPLSNYVWGIVIKWDYLNKNTVRMQFIRAVDSISANIAEGFGRRTKKDKIKFYNYSYGSIYESLDWNEKAETRNLLSEEQYLFILSQLKQLPKKVNSLIKFTNKNMSS